MNAFETSLAMPLNAFLMASQLAALMHWAVQSVEPSHWTEAVFPPLPEVLMSRVFATWSA
ncbi:MAG: hypothetical protein ABI193_11830 [Minicystis sp.]